MNLRLGLGVGVMSAAARPGVTSAPANVVLPSISGILTQGETLTANPGSWTGTPSGAYGYQWQRSGVNIGGATSATYVAQAADVAAGASAITVEVTATNDYLGGSSTTAESAGVTIAAPLTITGAPPAASVGVFYSHTFTVAGGHAPRTSAFFGTPLAGLSYDGTTHTLSGTPLSASTASGLSATVTDGDGLQATYGPFSITASSSFTPSLNFSDARNSQYLALGT